MHRHTQDWLVCGAGAVLWPVLDTYVFCGLLVQSCSTLMTLGFCVDGLVSLALCTTSLETHEHEMKDTTAVVRVRPRLCSETPRTPTEDSLTQYFFRNCSHCTRYLLLSAVWWKFIFSLFKNCLHALPLLFRRAEVLFSCCSLTRYLLAKGQTLNTMLWWILCLRCFFRRNL